MYAPTSLSLRKKTNKSVRAAVADQMFNSEDEVIWDTGFGCLECYFFREFTGGALVRKPQLGVAGDFIWTPSFHFMFNAGLVISAVLPTRGLQKIYRQTSE